MFGVSYGKGEAIAISEDHIFSLHSATATSVRRPVSTAAGAVDWERAVHYDREG